MSAQEAKLDKFSAAVLKDAEEHRSKILSEIEEYRKSQMDKAEEEILHEAYVMIQNEITSIRNDHTRRISLAELEGRKDLLLFRESLTQKVFEEAKGDIVDFTKSADYEKYMTDLLKKSLEAVPAGEIEFEVKKDDEALAEKLAKACGKELKVVPSANILLGGFILSNNDAGVVIDESFDYKIQKQNDWFIEKSGLSIDM